MYTTYILLLIYTLQCAHHQKHFHHLSPYSWTPFSHLCNTHPTPFLLVPITLFSISTCLFLFGLFIYCGLYFFVFYIAQMSEIMCYLSLTTWVISLSIICSRSIHAVTSGKVSYFLWLSSVPLCIKIYLTSSLSHR